MGYDRLVGGSLRELLFYLVEFLPVTEFIDGLFQDFKDRISICFHHCIFIIPKYNPKLSHQAWNI